MVMLLDKQCACGTVMDTRGRYGDYKVCPNCDATFDYEGGKKPKRRVKTDADRVFTAVWKNRMLNAA